MLEFIFYSLHACVDFECIILPAIVYPSTDSHTTVYDETGAERLLRHLHSKGVHIALATSSSRENYELKTTHHGSVFELFHHIVTGSDSIYRRT